MSQCLYYKTHYKTKLLTQKLKVEQIYEYKHKALEQSLTIFQLAKH